MAWPTHLVAICVAQVTRMEDEVNGIIAIDGRKRRAGGQRRHEKKGGTVVPSNKPQTSEKIKVDKK